MDEIHFNHPDMPRFGYSGFEDLPYWLMYPGQSMHIPYSDKGLTWLHRYLPKYNKRNHTNFTVCRTDNEIVIALYTSMFNYPKVNPSIKQMRIAEIGRMRVGDSKVYSDTRGIGGIVFDVRKLEHYSGKYFAWPTPSFNEINITRIR